MQALFLANFMDEEGLTGEARSMRIYSWGHVVEFVRPTLSPGVLPTAEMEAAGGG